MAESSTALGASPLATDPALARLAWSEGTVGMGVLDADDRFLEANPALCEILGRSQSELSQLTIMDVTAPEDRARVRALSAEGRCQTQTGEERRYVRPDGTIRHVSVSTWPWTLADGSTGTFGFVVDRTAEVEASERSFATMQRYERLFRASADVTAVIDGGGVVHFATPSAERLFGPLPERVDAAWLLERIHPDDAALAIAAATDALERRGDRTHTCRVITPDGETATVDVAYQDLRDDPFVQGVLINLRDVTERRRIENAFRHQATHDALTGLPNRSLLADRTAGARARAMRSQSTFAVLFCDLDHFKRINDTLGHDVGDSLLLAVAERLQSRLRASDTLARLGGDEFVLIIEELERSTAPVVALNLAEDLIGVLGAPFEIDNHLVSIGASIGIAVFDDADPDSDLLRDADVAMYAAKAKGRNLAKLHDERMRHETAHRFAMDSLVRSALAHDGVRVEYQPVVDLITQRIVGAEALVRIEFDGLRHPPGDFIPAAEETGTIGPLGEVILRRAVAMAAAWPEGRSVAVNVSARQLDGGDFVGTVLGALRESGLDPSNLIIEVTESALMSTSDAVDDAFARLHEAGVRIALDDFGTGWSSLSYLRRFPVSIVKIDRTFVAGVARIGSDDIEVIRAVISLANALGIDVVAEGIETGVQAAILAELGCTLGQGYFFGRPAPELPASLPSISVVAPH